MNQQQSPESEFERRLRGELTAIVAERSTARAADVTATRPAWRRRGARLGLSAAAVIAVAAAALIVNAGGGDTPAAFAVEAQPEGMVSVEIRSLEDPKGLETALGEAGIPASVTYLAAGTACKEQRFQPVPWPKGARAVVVGPPNGAPREPANATVVGGPEGARAVVQEPEERRSPITFWISRDAVGPGQTLVVTASASAEGILGAGTQVQLAEGSVATCAPVMAASP